jgi:peptidoglycan hydrolase CwlO-like protein
MDLFDEHQVVLIKLTEFAVYTLVVLTVCDSLYNAINHKIIDLKNEQKLFETMFDENVKIYNGNFDEIEDKFEKIENTIEQLEKQIHYLDKTVKEYTETTDDRIASIEFSNENNYKNY